MDNPIIGITGNLCVVDNDAHFNGMKRSFLNQDYLDLVSKSGAVPVILPVTDPSRKALTEQMVRHVDAVLLSGGYDISPSFYGEEALPHLGYSMKIIDSFYFDVIRFAEQYQKPVFGICKGMQALNVFYGGTLYQDISSQKPGGLQHCQAASYQEESHKAALEPDSFLFSSFGETQIWVNSHHHQAVRIPAPGFRITARASDGIAEGMERMDGVPLIGVQWHPEMMAGGGSQEQQKLFGDFTALLK